jgi:hypothetical protein
MGAWGTGSLENDAALDWLGDFESERSVGLLESTLALVADALPSSAVDDEDGDYLSFDEACAALAAAEVVASALGKSGPELSDDLIGWMEQHRTDLAVLAPLAERAVARVRDDSEAAELWAETDDLEGWCDVVNELISRLQVARA